MFGKMRKSGLLMAALLVFAAVAVKPAAVKAETSVVPDESIPATISITLKDVDDGTPAAGATVVAKKVGAVHVENGADYSFVPVDELAESGISFEDITSPSLAAELTKYISENKIELTTKEAVTGSDGFVSFSEHPIGIWLFENKEAADGFSIFNPFIVSVPRYDEAEKLYQYEVDASPKVSVKQLPSTPTPSITVTPSIGTPTPSTVTPSTATPKTPKTPNTPNTPTPVRDYSRLPQTGQLWWPVPVLALVGAAFVLVGWFRRRSN